MLNLNTPLRISQLLLSLVTIALNGYILTWYLHHTHPSSTPNEAPFLVFVAAFTLLALPYLFTNPSLSQTHHNKPSGRFFNKYAVLVLDLLTCVLWFAGAVGLAVFHGRLILCGGHVCQFMVGGIIVGMFAWLSFLATSVLAALHVMRTRKGSSGAEDKNHPGWVGATSIVNV